MIRCGHIDGVHVLVFQQFAEISVFGRVAAGHFRRLLDAALVGVAHGGHVGIRLRFEGGQVETADQAEADQAHVDSLVGAEHAAGGERG